MRQTLERARLDGQDGEQRNQTNERANLQVLGRPSLHAHYVVIEAVVRVPHANLAAEAVDRVRDRYEVLEELGGDRFVGRPRARKLKRHRQHVEAEQAHPGCPVGLLEAPAFTQVGTAAIEHTDVVQPQESAFKRIAPFGVFAVHPPREVEEQLVKDLLQERGIRFAGQLTRDFVHAPSRMGMHGRIRVGKVPLVGRELAARMHVPLAEQEHDLPLRPLRVEPGKYDAVKRRVPSREPGILPLVGHCENVEVVDVPPARVAAVMSFLAVARARPGRRPARAPRCSGRTVCSKADRRTPGAGPCGGLRPIRAIEWLDRTRRSRPSRNSMIRSKSANGSSSGKPRNRVRTVIDSPGATTA